MIGFHDVLVLRPLGLKPDRPRDDVKKRWALTNEALESALGRTNVVRLPVDLMLRLSQDVLVHTWDLARAVGAYDALDADWCTHFLDRLPPPTDDPRTSGMFARPVTLSDEIDAQSRLLARLGRDPAWRPGPGN